MTDKAYNADKTDIAGKAGVDVVTGKGEFRWRQLLGLWILGAMEIVMFVPLWLAVAIYIVPAGVRIVWLLTLPLLTLCGVLTSLRIAKAWVRFLAAAVPGFVHMLFFNDSSLHAALLFAASWTAVMRGMSVSSPESRANIVTRYVAGLLIYFFGYVIASHLPDWSAYLSLLTITGTVSLAAALFTINHKLLREESFSGNDRAAAAVRGLRGHNRWFVSVVLLGALIVAAAASGYLGRWLLMLLRALLRALLPSKQSPEPEPEPQPQAQPVPALPAADDKGWLVRVLDVLFYVIGSLAIAAIVFLLLRTLYRNRAVIAAFLRRALGRLSAWLGRSRRSDAGVGYVDEETTIFSWETIQSTLARKWLQHLGGRRAERWSEFRDNRERVRYLYREWLGGLGKRGYRASGALTPDEIRRDAERRIGTAGATKLVDLYYRARYGGAQDIADGEVEGVMSRQKSK